MKTPTQHPTIPPLVNGDKLTRDEFHRRYNAMPNLKKAELIEGIVYIGGADPRLLQEVGDLLPHTTQIPDFSKKSGI